jgi:hypothetical protein
MINLRLIARESGRSPSSVRRLLELRSSVEKANSFKTWSDSQDVDASRIIDELFAAQSRVLEGPRLLKSAPTGSFLADFAVRCARYPPQFDALWRALLRRLRVCVDRRELVPNIPFDAISFGNCLIYQKLQLVNYCIYRLRRGDPGFIQSEDLFEQSRVFFDQSQQEEFLLECHRTFFATRLNASNELFVQDFGRLPSNIDAVPTFDLLTQVELAMVFLEALGPVDVFDQVATVLIDQAFARIRENVPQDVAPARAALDAIRAAIGVHAGQGHAALWEACEERLAVIDMAKAVLAKVRDAAVASELVEKGTCVVGPDAKVFGVIDFEEQAERLVESQWFRFECTIDAGRGSQKQEMFVATNRAHQEKVVIATVARE